jgi:hypothetical protein
MRVQHGCEFEGDKQLAQKSVLLESERGRGLPLLLFTTVPLLQCRQKDPALIRCKARLFQSATKLRRVIVVTYPCASCPGSRNAPPNNMLAPQT